MEKFWELKPLLPLYRGGGLATNYDKPLKMLPPRSEIILTETELYLE